MLFDDGLETISQINTFLCSIWSVIILLLLFNTVTENQTRLGHAPFEPDILDFVVMQWGGAQKVWATEPWPVC